MSDRRDIWFVLGVLGYFALQTVSRILVSPSLGLDEAEQILLVQRIAWGYGSQPPLYTWLQAAVFALTGEGVAGLALLKNLLLAATLLVTYATVRRIAGSSDTALLAALSLFLIPQFAWESQRALTHSVLVMTMSAVFAWSMVRLLQNQRTLDYGLLGAAFALGLLSKFNFALGALALVLAALSMGRFRATLLCRRGLLVPLAAALLLAPSLIWILLNQEATLSRASKMTSGQTAGLLENYLLGLGSLLWAALAYLLLLLAVYAVAAFRGRAGQAGPARPAEERAFLGLFARAIGFGLLLCLLLVVGFEVTRFKDRWMQPLLYGAPIVLALWLAPRLAARRRKLVLGAAGLCALAVVVALPLRTLLGPSLGDPKPLDMPYGRFAEQIRALGFTQGVILSDSDVIAGNLLLALPGSQALTTGYPRVIEPRVGALLLAWRGAPGADPPPALAELYQAVAGAPLPAVPPHDLSALAYYASDDTVTLSVLLPSGQRSE